jgi:NAD(P)-dependent dehydrogenase (short-subunit alcohol dehydrogenase family)
VASGWLRFYKKHKDKVMEKIVVVGGSGALGSAFLQQLKQNNPSADLITLLRPNSQCSVDGVRVVHANLNEESEIKQAVESISQTADLDMVLIATGVLHTPDCQPEKSIRDLSFAQFHTIFHINTIIPSLCAKYFIPKMRKGARTVFAALSARVGSIADNQLGGWYSYRASKAALNMVIKNLAIEIGRFQKQAIIVGLHPGTVDSFLSQPFQAHVKPDHLFTAEYAATQLCDVVSKLSASDSGGHFAWDGERIPE